MSWNYRVMRYPDGYLGIHEVYYDDGEGTVNGYTVEAVPVSGEDKEAIQSTLQMMLAALDKPTLDYEEED